MARPRLARAGAQRQKPTLSSQVEGPRGQPRPQYGNLRFRYGVSAWRHRSVQGVQDLSPSLSEALQNIEASSRRGLPASARQARALAGDLRPKAPRLPPAENDGESVGQRFGSTDSKHLPATSRPRCRSIDDPLQAL